MTHVWADADTRLEVLTTNAGTFNLFMDNLASLAVGDVEGHHFAGMLVPKDDARQFIRNLAKAMDVPVEFPPDADLVELTTDGNVLFLTVDWDEEDRQFTISGDLREFLTDDEVYSTRSKWIDKGLDRGNPHGSVNYWIADLFEDSVESHSLGLDPEYSCFFAYADSQADVDEIRRYILEKRFLK